MKKYLIISLLLAVSFFINNYFSTKREEAREESNRINLQKTIVDLKNDMISFQSKDNKEFKQYLNETSQQLKGLKDKLIESDIKLKNITRVVSSSLVYRDSTNNNIVLDSINSVIKLLIAQQTDSTKLIIEYPFEEKNPCFWFKAKIKFDNGEFSVHILERGYNDTITHVGYLEKRQWKLFGIIKTRFLGRKIAKVELFNNCGESKTIIITNKQ